MNIFDQYGIKEVADVTLYSIHKKQDGSGEIYYVPALHLDTLKISTAEKTADSVWAEGGKGNARLINWDYGKTINVSLEDALCTPASLGLCWNGTLSADWKDAQIQYDTDVCYCKNPLQKLERFEKHIYPGQNIKRETLSYLLPHTINDNVDETLKLLTKSEIVDGTEINGHGIVRNHTYTWKMAIESTVKSIAVVPDRFFDVKGRSYPIDQNRKVSVTSLPTYENYKDAIIYKINTRSNVAPPKAKIIFDDAMEGGVTAAEQTSQNVVIENDENNEIVNYRQNRTVTSLFKKDISGKALINDVLGSVEEITEIAEICEADYLAIIVDNNNDYHAIIGIDSVIETSEDLNSAYDDARQIVWYQPKTAINVSQFKGIDMWLRFESINAMIYFLITKYADNISHIYTANINAQETVDTWGDGDGTWAVNKQVTAKETTKQTIGSLWAYINPRTMQPYADDYWLNQGEPYYIKSLTLTENNTRIKGNKIVVRADQWPGMYMMVGETYIRDKDTGHDEHLQIKFPLCKVKSDHTLTLQADGDPTTFNLDLEVAKPNSGAMMELTAYETAEKLIEGDNGCFFAVDGSTEVLIEQG